MRANTPTRSRHVSLRTLSGARERWIHSISARHIILSARSRRIGRPKKEVKGGGWGGIFCCTGNTHSLPFLRNMLGGGGGGRMRDEMERHYDTKNFLLLS